MHSIAQKRNQLNLVPSGKTTICFLECERKPIIHSKNPFQIKKDLCLVFLMLHNRKYYLKHYTSV